MRSLRAALLRVWGLFHRARRDRDLTEELDGHLRMHADDGLRAGLTPEEARRRARIMVGGVEQTKELYRERHSLPVPETLAQDLRYGWRMLWKHPAFAAVVILTLSLGIGANTAIFNIFDTVMLRPLPFRDADRLYVVHEVIPAIASTTPLVPVNALHFREWRAATRSFEEMALVGPADHTLTGAGEPARIIAARASPSLFRMLGAEPVLGRGFLDEEDAPGRDAVVILGHDLWTARFAADPGIIGRAITLDGIPHLVVGVLGEGIGLARLSHFYGVTVSFERPQLWKPFAAQPDDLRLIGGHNFVAIARLRSGVSPAEALDDLEAVQEDLARRGPPRTVFGAALVPMSEQIVGRSRVGLQLVLAVVAIVLLIACINITSLLLARGGARQRELAIRRAAGASRIRLVRQMLVEGLVMATVAGMAAVGVAAALVRMIRLYAPLDLPRVEDVGMDARAIAVTLGVTIVSGLLIGLLPAWRLTRTGSGGLLRAAPVTAAGGAGATRLRSLLVAVQVGASAVCLIAGMLLLNSFIRLMSVDRGFSAERVLTVDFELPSVRYDTDDKGVRFLDALAQRVRSLPGVDSVGFADALPLSGVSRSAIMIEGSNLPRQERPAAAVRRADAGYFRTMGIGLRAGRLFEESDAGRRVAVISSLAARRLWPGQDALGRRFRFGPDDSPYFEVVGVVGDVRADSLSQDPPLGVYVPLSGFFSNQAVLAVRTTADPRATSPAVRAIVRELDSELAVPAARTMDEIVADSVATRRFQMMLVLLLAAAAVFLAGLGIYGVVSQAVAQRTAEFGIRMALGADSGRIRHLVLRQGLLPVGAGLAAGLVASVVAARLLRSLLFGVSPTDVTPFAATSFFLVGVALIASLIPAWRASHIDPMAALRHE